MKRSAVLLFCGIIVLAGTLHSCKKEGPDTPTLTTAPVTKITATSALSGGDITNDGGAAITARGVCWSTSPNPMISDEYTSDSIGPGSYASTITGLQPEKTYYMRAYATNSAGTAYGQDISFKTLEQSGKFIDIRDNREYKWVRIDDQIWMAENLAYLPSVVPSFVGSNTDPYYYVYGYEGSSESEAKATDNYITYGVLYNWPAALNVCPAGWHLPSDAEWTQLTDYLGGEGVAGDKLKETGTTHWNSPNTGATNETVFTALPGGARLDYVNFGHIGDIGGWWSPTERSATDAYLWGIRYDSSFLFRDYYYKQGGFSVRCVKD